MDNEKDVAAEANTAAGLKAEAPVTEPISNTATAPGTSTQQEEQVGKAEMQPE